MPATRHVECFDAALVTDAARTTVSGLSSLLSFFAGIVSRPRHHRMLAGAGEEDEREARQNKQREENRREVEALQEQQAKERASWERRMQALKQALQLFEQ